MPRQKKYRPTLKFLIDSREQVPFTFGPLLRPGIFTEGGTRIQGLSEGDYACELDGEILSIRLERKSLGDFFSVAGWGRERLEREFERLRQYDYRALVIEASLDQVLRGYDRSQIPGRKVAASLASWSVDFDLHVWLCENNRRAAGFTQRLLEEYEQRVFLDKTK